LGTTRFKIKKNLHADYIGFMCFVWLSEQTVILSYTSLTDWFIKRKWIMFTERYGLSLYTVGW